MSASHFGIGRWGGGRALKQMALLASAILAGVVLLAATASSASAKAQVGLYLAGEESGEKAKQPRFEAESYPAYIFSSEDKTYEYTVQAGTMKCPGGHSGKLSGAASELFLAPTYIFSACTFGGSGNVTITANGCEHIVTVLNQGPPYVGQFGVKCPAGKSYEFHTPNCTIAIPAQTGLTGVSYSNTGSGKSRAVQVTINVSGLKYSLKGPFPFGPCSGTHENGTYTGSMTLKGFDE
jgi:hypothetical protein